MGGLGSVERDFHPAVASWLRATFKSPTPPQAEAWPRIASGENVLVAAPTGSGKTLCAFLASIDALVREAQEGALPEETRVLYVSPLKALSNDIERNLSVPLGGVRTLLASSGYRDAIITTAVRTGDTTARERALHTKHPAHIYVTTPESFYILLTSDGGRRMLSTVRTVIIDEVHALVRDKRGSHLALSLERLDDLLAENDRPRAQRIGLSATQKPIERVAEYLTGFQDGSTTSQRRPCSIVDKGHTRALDLSLCVPGSPLESVMSAECWTEIYDQLADLVRAHKTTLIFTNTRKLSERITRFLAERIGEETVTSHHGSLSRQRRHAAELALKEGKLKALVATASLELGIDVGDVDLVCQIGSPKSIATFLQRVGRSGHFVGGTPKGRIFPLSRDDLVECVALLEAAQLGELDEVKAPVAPLDILAQQIVAWVAPGERPEEALLESIRRSGPYHGLSTEDFSEVVRMLADGFSTSRGRRGAYLHHDQVGGRLKARRGARLAAITNGGAIPDNFDYDVLLEPAEVRIGSVNEDFAIESMAGDIFQLGNTSYQIIKVDPGIVRVADAHGQPPTIPFWIGEAPSRSDELSWAVSRLRSRVAQIPEDQLEEFQGELERQLHLPARAASQMVDYLRATLKALGHMPTQSKIVVERFFDETEGMHVVIHSPFGSRFNRAFGLALRKRFCRSFNVELQAAAGEDALVLSLGPMHSFPLESLFQFLKKRSVRDVLVQALLDAPLFQTRWRWNASRALAILRFRSGKKVPPRFQRMQSDDLLALCFPDQVACLENIPGDRNIPEHPLVRQTISDSLFEAMDVERLEHVLGEIEAGHIECVARDLTEPSPLSHEILSARPYAFLDDAPLEERRTQAIQMRRFADPESQDDLGKLDPSAIDQVLADAAPSPRDADELHDCLLVYGCLPESESPYQEFLSELLEQGRLLEVSLASGKLFFATERYHLARAVYSLDALEQKECPRVTRDEPLERADALVELVRGRLEMVGPTTQSSLAQALQLTESDAESALLALESEGFVLRGRFRTSAELEYCERRLLSRIHRLTLNKLRREIEPVSPATYLRFLTHHQNLAPDARKEGTMGTLAVLEQLSGFACAAESWEASILPSRVRLYQPAHLDSLCLSGQITWAAARRSHTSGKPPQTLSKASPLRILPRSDMDLWQLNVESQKSSFETLHPDAKRVATYLKGRGASFFNDIRRGTGLLESQAERAVSELIGAGLVTTDSFTGVRSLLTPAHRRGGLARPGSRARRVAQRGSLEAAGRISFLEAKLPDAEGEGFMDPDESEVEAIAWQLLSRWGIVFRKVLERESGLPPWSELLRIYHRLEARGEIRGGRFVNRFSGEQFATPEAIQSLRMIRKGAPSGTLLKISGSDPLNLLGILTPGDRLPATPKNALLLRDGIPVAALEGGVTRLIPGETLDLDGNIEPGLTEHEASRVFRARDVSGDWLQNSAQ